MFQFTYLYHPPPPPIRHPWLSDGLIEHRVQSLLTNHRALRTSKFQTYAYFTNQYQNIFNRHTRSFVIIHLLPVKFRCSLPCGKQFLDFFYDCYMDCLNVLGGIDCHNAFRGKCRQVTVALRHLLMKSGGLCLHPI